MRCSILLDLVLRASGLAVTLLGSSCVSFKAIEQAELPATWKTEIERPRTVSVELSGTFADRGLIAGPKYRENGSLNPASLSEVLFKSALGQKLPSADVVVFVQRRPDLLECSLQQGGAVVWNTELKIETDLKTGVVALPSQSNKYGSGASASGGFVRSKAYLLKGSDGDLFVHFDTSYAGVFFLVPYIGGVNTWGRWKSSPPPPPETGAGRVEPMGSTR